MSPRKSLWVWSWLAAAVVWFTPSIGWAVHFPLGKSSDDWGMKYTLELDESSGDMLTVSFTLTDGGRLTPIHSATLVAFSKPHSDGGRSYLVKAPFQFRITPEGHAVGQVQIPKKHAPLAQIRILTLHVDGRRQTAGAAYYDIPLKKS